MKKALKIIAQPFVWAGVLFAFIVIYLTYSWED